MPILHGKDINGNWSNILGSSDVFWAEYEKTTYAEVQAAVDAGKVCLLNYMGTVYTMTFQNKSPLWFDFISVTSGVIVKLCRIKSDDSWSNSSSSALTSGQIDTFITQDSKDGHVPTSKAVYDAIQEFGVTDEKIVSAIITYMEDNPIEVPPVGRAVVVLAGTDFDDITVYSVVAPDQESDPVELLKAREADVLLILTKEDGLTAAPLVLSEFNPDDFTGEAYGDVVTEDGVYNVAVQFGFEGSWVSVTVNSAFTGGSSGVGWVEIMPETEGVREDSSAIIMILPGMVVSPGDRCRVSYYGNGDNGEINVTTEVVAVAYDDLEFPSIALGEFAGDDPNPNNMQTFALYSLPEEGVTFAMDVNYSNRCVVRVEKYLGDGVSREEFDALVDTVETKQITTYILQKGETVNDAPDWAEEVIDPYADSEEDDIYKRVNEISDQITELDNKFAEFDDALATVIGSGVIV